jgi:hypothetical protein
MGILIICAKNYDCPKLSKLKKIIFTQNVHNFFKKIIIFLSSLKTKTEVQIIFHQLVSIFEFRAKKAKKSKFLNSVENEKTISEKSSSTKFLYTLGESMFKKSAKSEMVTGRLVDSYKKLLLSALRCLSHFQF